MPKSKGLFGGVNKKVVNIQRDYYSMASTDGQEAEIVLYGEIVETRPTDWWTDEPIPGNFIVMDEFLDDLKEIEKASKITMRINSIGGNAFVSITIHNKLRELKGELIAIVDGVAMSGGSLIMCAADKVQVNASSLIMIHKCSAILIGRYNSEELQKIVSSNESIDKAGAAIYRRKTGMSEEDILSMMGDETYMTGKEAIEKGFADELLDTEAPEIAASADFRTIYVNGRSMHSAIPIENLPDSIPIIEAANSAVEINTKQPAQTGSDEGGKTMANTLEELKRENPDLASQLMSEAQAAVSIEASGDAVNDERLRIREIDEISALYSEDMVQEAKYGENPCTAQELAHRAAKKMAETGKGVLSNLEDDTKAADTAKVSAAPGPETNPGEENLTPEQRMAKGREAAQALNKKEDK